MKKGFGSHLAAGIIDIVAGLFLCYILHWFFGYYFASRAIVTLHIGAADSLWKGLIPWLMGLFAAYVYTLPLAFFLIFVPEAIWSWSIGKKMLGIKIEGKPKDLWLRFILKTSGAWGITLALIVGSWQLLVFFLGVGIVVILGRLYDRLTATKVI